MPEKMTIRDISVQGKRAFVRVDFNVPFTPGTTDISDDTRIRASLPTIRHLREQGARVILASHLGRPRGVEEGLRMRPIAARLGELLNVSVAVTPDCVGSAAEEAVQRLGPGDVLLLENLRFHAEEEKNDPTFAQSLAKLADVYVNDAFGTAHRAHASTAGIASHLPAVAGFLMEAEIKMLGQILESPHRPLAALLGGAKVADKMEIMESLVARADFLLVGGGMAAAFLAGRGLNVGRSLLEAEGPQLAARIESAARTRGIQLLLPVDVVVGPEAKAGAPARTVSIDAIPGDQMLLDIGPRTRETYARAIRLCQTVLWNGPMGVFEVPAFSEGTKSIASTLAERSRSGATVVVGGGSTAEAVTSLGLASAMTHVSTGGGASLEFLEGKVLPGVAALRDKASAGG